MLSLYQQVTRQSHDCKNSKQCCGQKTKSKTLNGEVASYLGQIISSNPNF